jgi:hypothetical protein
MSKQTVYNILASAKKEPVKVELALVDDYKLLKSKIISDKDEIISEIQQVKSLVSKIIPKINQNLRESAELSDLDGQLSVSSRELGVNWDSSPIRKDYRRAFENQKDIMDFASKFRSL